MLLLNGRRAFVPKFPDFIQTSHHHFGADDLHGMNGECLVENLFRRKRVKAEAGGKPVVAQGFEVGARGGNEA